MTRIDRLIEALFDALPASNYKEIAARISKKTGERITEDIVNNLLNRLRTYAVKDPDKYGWTVPHVKRGTENKEDEAGRFFPVLLTKGGGLEYGKDQRVHMRAGFKATVKLVASQSANEVAALKAAALHEMLPARRRMLIDLADDLSYVSRKATALLAEIESGAA